MTYERMKLAENIGFSEIIDSKFKKGAIEISFITPLDPETLSENASATVAVSMTNSKYPTITEFSSKLNSLYGSDIFSRISKVGNFQVNSISAVWLDSKYALEGEDIETETVKMLLDCIFSPDVKDNGFNQKIFDIVKKDIQSKIDSEINNKRLYALKQAYEIAFKGEPAEYASYGTSESLQNVTAESAYKAFKNLIANSQIEISYVSAQKNDSIIRLLSESFCNFENKFCNFSFISFSPIKENVERLTETLDVNQSKMVLAFKSEKDDKYAMKMLSALYGETPFSKLFANVREKMSLCYYCASHFSGLKNCIFVDCGVETKNIETAEKAILEQLDEIIKGNFSDEDIQNILVSIENSFSGIGDTINSYINWYKSAVYEGEYITPEKKLEEYRNVTRERIIECAKSLVLDTVYIMKSREE